MGNKIKMMNIIIAFRWAEWIVVISKHICAIIMGIFFWSGAIKYPAISTECNVCVKYEAKCFVSASENCTCTVHSSSSNSSRSDLFNIDRCSAFISSHYLLSIQVSKVSLLSPYSYFMCFECTRLHPNAVYHHENGVKNMVASWVLSRLAEANDAIFGTAAND